MKTSSPSVVVSHPRYQGVVRNQDYPLPAALVITPPRRIAPLRHTSSWVMKDQGSTREPLPQVAEWLRIVTERFVNSA